MYVCTPSYTIIYIYTYVRYILVSNIVLRHYLQSTKFGPNNRHKSPGADPPFPAKPAAKAKEEKPKRSKKKKPLSKIAKKCGE